MTAVAMVARASLGMAMIWTRMPTDLAKLITALDLKDIILVGHSTGGGGSCSLYWPPCTQRIAKAVLIRAIPPLMLKTTTHPNGVPLEVFNDMRANMLADRAQYFKDFSGPFYGANRPNANVSGP